MNWYDESEPVNAWAEGWVRLWSRLAEGFVETQRATAAAFWPAGFGTGDVAAEASHPEEPWRLETPLPSMTYRRDDWTSERTVDAVEDVGVGEAVSFTKRITDGDVREFARASGDTNRLHLDDAFARETRFGERIVHGTLVAGLISAALARLPGLTIYLSQDVRYLHPVRVDEVVTAECEVAEDLGGGKFRLMTTVRNEDDEAVIDGEAVVLIDDLPEAAIEE